MQYIDPNSSSLVNLYFPMPVNRVGSSQTIQFTSYERNFSVTGAAVYGTHFARVQFNLTSEQRTYFTDATTWEVRFGSSTIHVQGNKPSSTVIEYQS